MSKPLAIDLYCGLGGWTEGLLAEGYRVVGFDIERHEYGDHRYPAHLVIQDVLTLHGSQFKDAALIVASPPCQEYSYMAMPWTLAKEKQRLIESDPAEQKRLTALFDACFRIQREACEAAGRHIPLVVENVRGAQKWVGRAAWHFGSFYLWGDIPALMPITISGLKAPKGTLSQPVTVDGAKQLSPHWRNKTYLEGAKNSGGSWFNIGSPGQKETNNNPVHQIQGRFYNPEDGVKVSGNKLSENGFAIPVARMVDKTTKPSDFALNSTDKRNHLSYSRKAASAMIAKIPFVLACWIARAWKP